MTDPFAMSLFLGRVEQTFSGNWSNQATTTLDLIWPTPSDAAEFFNTDGEIRIRPSIWIDRPTAQNNSWLGLLTRIGTIDIDGASTSSSAGVSGGTSIGYLGLTDTGPTEVYSSGPGVGFYYYAANTFTVRGQVLGLDGTPGSNGSTLRLTVTLTDAFAGELDLVEGMLVLSIDELRCSVPTMAPTFQVKIVEPLRGT